MKILYTRAAAAILGLALGLGSAAAGNPQIAQEDLSECRLPHGIAEIPEQGSPAALKAGGEILKLDGRRLVASPWARAEKKPKSMDEFVQRVRGEKTGDLSYSSLNGGTLVAMSGKLNDLGKHFLYELGAKDLARPDSVWGKEERDSAGKGMPGAIENVEVGCCYLIETVDGLFALIRIVSKQERSATVQWVLQPNGTTTFDIPKAVVVAMPDISTEAPPQLQRSDASRQGVLRTESSLPAPEPLTKQPLAESLKTHLDNRRSIIQSLLGAVVDRKCTVDEKSVAIRALGEMAASESATTLASMIDFFDSSAPSLSLTIDGSFPCVPALVRIGKPSVFACTRVLADAQSDRTIGLHAEVIARVEGKRSAQVLLMDKMEKVKDEGHRKNLEAVLQRIRAGPERLSVFDNMCTDAAGGK